MPCDIVSLDHPVLFAGEIDRVIDQWRVVVRIDVVGRTRRVPIGRRLLDISPAGRFCDDRLVDLTGEPEVAGNGRRLADRAAIEHVLVDTVCEEHAELLVDPQPLQWRTAASARAVAVPAKLIEGDLLVPHEEAELAIAAVHVGGGVAVVVRPVFGVGVEVEQHVVDVVLDVDVVFRRLVDRVAGDVAIEDSHHGVPA